MHQRFDRSKIKTRSLKEREHKMTLKDIKPLDAKFKKHSDLQLELLVKQIAEAYKGGHQVILSMGAHPLRCGNSRFIIDLMERGVITHIATTDAVPIHDFELAYIGATLEDVEKYIADGSFGHWNETAEAINFAAELGYRSKKGLGQTIGQVIEKGLTKKMPHKDISIFAAAYRLKIPITVHKLMGGVITDQHPSANFAALGKTSGDDFLVFANSISKLQHGVFLCWGSQIMGPEIYLKALSMARNVAGQKGRKINKFTTAVFDNHELGNWRKEKDIVNYRNKKSTKDERYYYRPLKTILTRTIRDGGKSFYIKGDFNITIPVFYHRVIQLIKKPRAV